MAYGRVSEDTVYTCTGQPLRSDIANILDWSLNKDFSTAYKRKSRRGGDGGGASREIDQIFTTAYFGPRYWEGTNIYAMAVSRFSLTTEVRPAE